MAGTRTNVSEIEHLILCNNRPPPATESSRSFEVVSSATARARCTHLPYGTGSPNPGLISSSVEVVWDLMDPRQICKGG